jgi:hypothetical protein
VDRETRGAGAEGMGEVLQGRIGEVSFVPKNEGVRFLRRGLKSFSFCGCFLVWGGRKPGSRFETPASLVVRYVVLRFVRFPPFAFSVVWG